MANVRSRGQTHERGYQSREKIDHKMRPAKPRDDLTGAFAGEENKATHGSRVKSRKLPAKSEKTPKI